MNPLRMQVFSWPGKFAPDSFPLLLHKCRFWQFNQVDSDPHVVKAPRRVYTKDYTQDALLLMQGSRPQLFRLQSRWQRVFCGPFFLTCGKE
jgi:hypothetical protein